MSALGPNEARVFFDLGLAVAASPGALAFLRRFEPGISSPLWLTVALPPAFLAANALVGQSTAGENQPVFDIRPAHIQQKSVSQKFAASGQQNESDDLLIDEWSCRIGVSLNESTQVPRNHGDADTGLLYLSRWKTPMPENTARVHVTEDELARDTHGVLKKVQEGIEVIVEQDHRPVALMKTPQCPGRKLGECIALAK
jgi:antitoxin (DNA-binding transcriptional repressor) of toxin-antitoxin stability system